MSDIKCPTCGGKLSCVGSQGVYWRCYGHGERTYDMSASPEAQRQAAGLRSLSASNAAAIRGAR